MLQTQSVGKPLWNLLGELQKKEIFKITDSNWASVKLLKDTLSKKSGRTLLRPPAVCFVFVLPLQFCGYGCKVAF